MESRAQKVINLLARSETPNAQIESENAGSTSDITQQDGCFIAKELEDIQDHIPLENINSEPAEILNHVDPNQDSNVSQPIAEMNAPIASSFSSSSSCSSSSSDSSSSSSSSRSTSPVKPIEYNRSQNNSILSSILIPQSQTEPTWSEVSYHISPINSE